MTKVFRLPNGVTCVTDERPKSGKVAMQIRLKAGSADERAEENGLTYLMQEATNGGTTTQSREQLAARVEAGGGMISTTTERTATIFQSFALTRFAGDTFGALADMVRRPAFDAAEVKKTKAQIAQWQAQEEEDPGTTAALKFYEAAFAGQGLAANPMGTPELLASFTPAQVRAKHAELLAHPENIIVSFAGDIDATTAEKMVQDQFGDLPPAAAPLPRNTKNFRGGDIREPQDNEQLSLQLGFKAPGGTSPDRFAALLLQEYLSGGMSSPLFQEVREKRGLVYSVYAGYHPFSDDGVFKIGASAGKGNAGELIAVALGELGKIARDGVTEKDLATARERILRGIKAREEDAQASCERNAALIAAQGHIVPIEEHEANLRRVTADDIRRLCVQMMKDGNYAFSGVGPQDTIPAETEIRALVQKQAAGVSLPPAPEALPSTAKPQFTHSAKKAEAAHAAPQMTVLKNGMKVVTIERPGTLSCGAWVGVGSDNETPARNGATHMNEHMMFKGTPSYPPGAIDRIVEGELLGDLNAYTSTDRTVYYFFNLESSGLEKTVDICGEMVFQANIAEEEFDGKTHTRPDGTKVKAKGERDVVIEEIKEYADDVGDVAWNLALATAYPDQPHGRPILGTEQTLRAMTAQQLRDYRDEFYTPNNVIFCAAGPVKHEDFVKIVEGKYGALQPKDVQPLPVPSYKGGTAFIEDKNAAHSHVRLLLETVPANNPDSIAHTALSMILGSGSSSRLAKKIVQEQELSAGVGASAQLHRNCGMLTVGARVEAKNVKAFVGSVYAEMRKLETTVTQDELDKVKTMMEVSILQSHEVNRELCDTVASHVQEDGRIVTPEELLEQVRKLTLDDIRRTLRQVMAVNPTLTMVVPPGTDPKLLPVHDEVVAYRDGKGPGSPRDLRPAA